jgi:hypothetical protein
MKETFRMPKNHRNFHAACERVDYALACSLSYDDFISAVSDAALLLHQYHAHKPYEFHISGVEAYKAHYMGVLSNSQMGRWFLKHGSKSQISYATMRDTLLQFADKYHWSN